MILGQLRMGARSTTYAALVISISLLLVSRYSKLESDRSRFQIYNNIKKEYAAFRAAELVDNRDILDFFRDKQGPEEDEHK